MQAAAPQPPQVEVTSESGASTASLIDVDTPSVRTVPSDFAEQDIKTDTQATRIELEEEAKKERERKEKEEQEEQEQSAKDKARAEAHLAKKKAQSKARKADSWITKQLESMSDGASSALVAANMLAVVGLSGWLGYKAWGLYDHGRLGWKQVGLGLGVMGVVGAVEGVFAGYLYKAKGKEQ